MRAADGAGPARRAVRVAVVLLVALVASAGCSGGDESSPSPSSSEVGAPADRAVVASAVRGVQSGGVQLDESATRSYLAAVFGAKWGFAAASRACAVDRMLQEVGGDQALGSYLSGESGNRAEAAAAEQCATPEDTARRTLEQSATDLDLADARRALRAVAAAQAAAVGFTEAEADCYAAALEGDLSDEQVTALFARRGFSSELDLGEVVGGCLSAARLGRLAEDLATTPPSSTD